MIWTCVCDVNLSTFTPCRDRCGVEETSTEQVVYTDVSGHAFAKEAAGCANADDQRLVRGTCELALAVQQLDLLVQLLIVGPVVIALAYRDVLTCAGLKRAPEVGDDTMIAVARQQAYARILRRVLLADGARAV